VAVSLVLLIAAGLLVRTLELAQSTDVRFDSKELVVLSMDLNALDHDQARATALRAQLAERLKNLPGIQSVSSAQIMPFAGRRDDAIDLEGGESGLRVNANAVSPGYFQTLGIQLLRGRQFTEDDARSGSSSAIVSQAMVNSFWANVDPLGKRFRDGDGKSHEIIGVVGDISSTHLGKLDGPLFYTTDSLTNLGAQSFVVRTIGDAKKSVSAIREAAHSVDEHASFTVEPLEENIRHTLEPARTGAWFSGTISLLALIIAATGIYGVLSYRVVERTSEIGIRMALGAQSRDVLLFILLDGMKLAIIGTAIGVAAGIVVSRVLGSMMFGVASTDAITFAAVSLGALVVALLACYIPARRATNVDPLVALRSE
jgi:predicted permease